MGPARWPSGARPMWTGAAPTAATAAGAATSGWWPPPTSRHCSGFRDHPHRRGGDGGHGGRQEEARGPRRRPRGAGAGGHPGPGRRRVRPGRPGPGRATGGWPARAAVAAGAMPASSPTAGGRRPSPSRGRRATSSGTTSSWPWWPTWPWSGFPTWARAPSSRGSRRPSPRSPTTRSPPSSPTWAWSGPTTGSNFTVADIPGLVEGAAQGKGLGHRFLRHITRSRVLVVLVELDPVTGVPPAEQHRVLLDELERYQPDLIERPRLVVGSKVDTAAVGAGQVAGSTAPAVDFGDLRPDVAISAVTGQGIPQLVGRLSRPGGRGPGRRARGPGGDRHPPAPPRGVRRRADRATVTSGWWARWPSGRWPSMT